MASNKIYMASPYDAGGPKRRIGPRVGGPDIAIVTPPQIRQLVENALRPIMAIQITDLRNVCVTHMNIDSAWITSTRPKSPFNYTVTYIRTLLVLSSR